MCLYLNINTQTHTSKFYNLPCNLQNTFFTINIAINVYQLILFDMHFSIFIVKQSQVKSCLIRLNAYSHNIKLLKFLSYKINDIKN